VLTALLWLLATVALAVALPTAWAQRHIVDADGYANFAQGAAHDQALQRAVAAELTTQIGNLASGDVSSQVLGLATASYTASSSFPPQFAEVNRLAHRWLFTDTVRSELDSQGRWVVDIAPMLSDSTFTQTLDQYNISLPSSLPVPLTENAPQGLQPGRLQNVAAWGPWASVGTTVLAGVFAVLMLAVARRRGKALVALGVSALLVGGAGSAGLEIGRRYVDRALSNTPDDIREIANAMFSQAVSSMHSWLNVTLLAGVGAVLVGLVFSVIGGMFGRTATRDAPRTPPVV